MLFLMYGTVIENAQEWVSICFAVLIAFMTAVSLEYSWLLFMYLMALHYLDVKVSALYTEILTCFHGTVT